MTCVDQGARFRLLRGPVAVVLLGILYLATLPAAHTISDSYQWIGVAQNGSLREQLHPHHLIYIPVVKAFRYPLMAVGFSDWIATQVLSVVAGLIGLAAFAWLIHRITQDDIETFWATLAFGSSFTTWFFAVEVEVYGATTGFLLLAFACLVRATEQPSAIRFFAAGAVCGFAGLFHQTACFLLIPICVAGLFWADSFFKRFAFASAGVLGFGLVAGIPYVLAGFVVEGITAPGPFLHWLTTHAQQGFANGFSFATPIRILIGFSRSLVYGTPLVDAFRAEHPNPDYLAASICLLSMAFIVGAFLYITVRSVPAIRNLTPSQQSVLALATLWLLTHGTFSAYYEPQNIEWWAIPMAPAFFILSITAHGLPQGRGTFLLAILAVALFAGNLVGDFLPRRHPDFDRFYAAAQELEQQAGKNGLVLAPSLITPRLSGNHFSLYHAIRNHPDRLDRALGEMIDCVESTLAAGHDVAMLEIAFAHDKLRYHPNAKPLISQFKRLCQQHAEMRATVRLPIDSDLTPEKIAPLGEFAVYRLQSGSPQADDWLAAARAWKKTFTPNATTP